MTCWTEKGRLDLLDREGAARSVGQERHGSICWTRNVWLGLLDREGMARSVEQGRHGSSCWTGKVRLDLLDGEGAVRSVNVPVVCTVLGREDTVRSVMCGWCVGQGRHGSVCNVPVAC